MKVTDYYRTLGVDFDASIKDIRNAYRLKAKKYHPDLNPSIKDSDSFIMVTEAYQYLLEKHKYLKKLNKILNDKESFDENWKAGKRRKAQQYARRHAQMKAEQFEKSYLYKSALLISSVYDYFIFVVGILAIILSIYGMITKIMIGEFTVETIIVTVFSCILGFLFVFFTYKKVLRV